MMLDYTTIKNQLNEYEPVLDEDHKHIHIYFKLNDDPTPNVKINSEKDYWDFRGSINVYNWVTHITIESKISEWMDRLTHLNIEIWTKIFNEKEANILFNVWDSKKRT